MEIEIEPATNEDLPDVLEVLDDAAAWLQRIGVTRQWPAVISADEEWIGLLAQLVERRQVFAARAEGRIVGVCHLRDEPDFNGVRSHTWPDEFRTQPARYLYTLAVSRKAAGQGVAKAILDWAMQEAGAEGRVLRLDCWAGNDKLRQFYAGAGFEHCGDVELRNRKDGSLYSVSRFQRSV